MMMTTVPSKYNPFKTSEIEYNMFELEINYLYTVFNYPNLLNDIICNPNYFIHELTKQIYEYILHSNDNDLPITKELLMEYLSSNKIIINMEQVYSLFEARAYIPQKSIYKTVNIIKQNKMKYDIKKFGAEIYKLANSPSETVDNLLIKSEEYLNNIYLVKNEEGNKLKDVTSEVILATENIHVKGEDFFLRTGDKELDDKLGLVMKNILLIGGAAKHGKTKFIMSIISQLLENYGESIAIQWYNMEDDNHKMIRGFISPKLLLNHDELCGKKRKLTADEIIKFKNAVYAFEKYDIEFNQEPVSVKKIQTNFKSFIKKRKGKLPILIVDNIMLLTDTGTIAGQLRDDYIMNTFNVIKQNTGALIILVHHFNDAQQDKDNLSRAYRPLLKDLKGTESFRRVPKQVVLVNYPFMYKDLVSSYRGYEDILKYMYIVEIAANRDSKGEDNEDMSDNTLLHYYASLEYNIFKNINTIY